MTDAATLQVRHVRLADSATLTPATIDEVEGVFVALDDPPPVRTVLGVTQGEQTRTLEVLRVVEVATADAARGFYGRWADDEAQGRATKVGTEHLEDGTPQVQPVSRDHSAAISMSDGMAMPAPVMLDDDGHEDSGQVEAAREDTDAEAAAEAEAAPQEATPADAEATPAEAEAAPQEAAPADAEAAGDGNNNGGSKRSRRSRGGRRKRGGKRGR